MCKLVDPNTDFAKILRFDQILQPHITSTHEKLGRETVFSRLWNLYITSQCMNLMLACLRVHQDVVERILHGSIVISGKPGEGKSCAAANILQPLLHEKGRLVISSAGKWDRDTIEGDKGGSDWERKILIHLSTTKANADDALLVYEGNSFFDVKNIKEYTKQQAKTDGKLITIMCKLVDSNKDFANILRFAQILRTHSTSTPEKLGRETVFSRLWNLDITSQCMNLMLACLRQDDWKKKLQTHLLSETQTDADNLMLVEEMTTFFHVQVKTDKKRIVFVGPIEDFPKLLRAHIPSTPVKLGRETLLYRLGNLGTAPQYKSLMLACLRVHQDIVEWILPEHGSIVISEKPGEGKSCVAANILQLLLHEKGRLVISNDGKWDRDSIEGDKGVHQDIVEWILPEHGSIVISGKPGEGKSCVAANILQLLLHEKGRLVISSVGKWDRDSIEGDKVIDLDIAFAVFQTEITEDTFWGESENNESLLQKIDLYGQYCSLNAIHDLHVCKPLSVWKIILEYLQFMNCDGRIFHPPLRKNKPKHCKTTKAVTERSSFCTKNDEKHVPMTELEKNEGIIETLSSELSLDNCESDVLELDLDDYFEQKFVQNCKTPFVKAVAVDITYLSKHRISDTIHESSLEVCKKLEVPKSGTENKPYEKDIKCWLRDVTWLPMDKLPIPVVDLTVAHIRHESLDTIFSELASDTPPGPQKTMKYELLRICTYRNFPQENKPYSIRLAGAGFYYAAEGDELTCYCCGLRKRGWKAVDIPFILHERASPTCSFFTKNLDVNVPVPHPPDTKPNRLAIFDAAQETTTPAPGAVAASAMALPAPGTNSLISESARHVVQAQKRALTTNADNRQRLGNMAHQTANRPLQQQNSSQNAARSQNEAVTQQRGLGIDFDKPKHPQYAVKQVRRQSYENWPQNVHQRPDDLVDAGFYYAGFGDCVRCFYCGIGLRHWSSEDNPWIEHARWSASCVYLRQVKGDEFVDLVQLAVQYSNEGDEDIPGSEAGAAESGDALRQRTPMEDTQNYLLTDAAQSVLEMGYQPRMVQKGIDAVLKQKGREGITATSIMEKVLEMEDTATTNTLHRDLAIMNLNKTETEQKSEKKEDANSEEDKMEKKDGDTKADTKKILQQNKELKEQTLCKVCLDNPVCIVFLPCGHLVTCDECAPAMRKCPICRAVVKGTVKTYMA